MNAVQFPGRPSNCEVSTGDRHRDAADRARRDHGVWVDKIAEFDPFVRHVILPCADEENINFR